MAPRSASGSSSNPMHPFSSVDASAASARSMPDCMETRSVSLEWKLNGLSKVFEQSRGDQKSRVLKSALFGDGKWEVYFYGNSGADYVSLYLSAEPTLEEREAGQRLAAKRLTGQAGLAKSASSASLSSATQGHNKASSSGNTLGQTWVREGSFRFVFEIRPLGNKTAPIKLMEATEHTFSSEARNWGWQSFARRTDVYYNNPTSKAFDAFIIACTITELPSAPTQAQVPIMPKKLVPLELLDAFAGMFDDPLYSDVKFIIRTRSRRTMKRKDQPLFAIKKILCARAEYFEMMFSSGFIEGNPPASGDVSQAGMGTEDAANDDSDMSSVGSDEDLMEYDSFDEDDEEDDTDAVPSTKRPDSANTGDEDELEENDGEDEQTAHTSIAQNENEDLEEVYVAAESQMEGAEGHSDETVPAALGGQQVGLSPRGPSSLTTSTMRSASAMLHSGAPFPTAGGQKTLVRQNSALSSVSAADNEASVSTSSNRPAHSRKRSRSGNSRAEDSGRRYTEVVVTDATYSAYKALLYYLYTDVIVFAPLSSTYTHAKDSADLAGVQFPYHTRRDYFASIMPVWLKGAAQPALPSPDLVCSAKAIYKLADKLNMPELKARAFEHIVSSLTVETIPYEAFSSFSDQFREVRKVQIDMMLQHWDEIRAGQSLKNVFRLVRTDPDRFPGADEVMPTILSCLEYKRPSPPSALATPAAAGASEQGKVSMSGPAF